MVIAACGDRTARAHRETRKIIVEFYVVLLPLPLITDMCACVHDAACHAGSELYSDYLARIRLRYALKMCQVVIL